jgi:hypothetical protein
MDIAVIMMVTAATAATTAAVVAAVGLPHFHQWTPFLSAEAAGVAGATVAGAGVSNIKNLITVLPGKKEYS